MLRILLRIPVQIDMRLLGFQAETSREYQNNTQAANSIHRHASSFASKLHKDCDLLVIQQGFFVAFQDRELEDATGR